MAYVSITLICERGFITRDVVRVLVRGVCFGIWCRYKECGLAKETRVRWVPVEAIIWGCVELMDERDVIQAQECLKEMRVQV
ncbi:hypothetical protein NDU88_003466 [Pleurodeles waltl]|uniref:Uncharacterized protein n=1 Tax=Pleurodeles waltl TaxID=8319 RepID=A0AAV7MYL3_PLEWA|nr:hypothetical protein NDU88_003466 [Pleurodeles waltl]